MRRMMIMFDRCPFAYCQYKTSSGYCMFTCCINPAVLRKTYPISYGSFKPQNQNPCQYCSNNPANGGSGICHCILGGMTWV